MTYLQKEASADQVLQKKKKKLADLIGSSLKRLFEWPINTQKDVCIVSH